MKPSKGVYMSYDNIVVLCIILGTFYFLYRMVVENFDSNHGATFLHNDVKYKSDMEKYLNSIHMPTDWRNAYLKGGGNPLAEITPRTKGGSAIPSRPCNYPFKPKNKPPFFY